MLTPALKGSMWTFINVQGNCNGVTALPKGQNGDLLPMSVSLGDAVVVTRVI